MRQYAKISGKNGRILKFCTKRAQFNNTKIYKYSILTIKIGKISTGFFYTTKNRKICQMQ